MPEGHALYKVDLDNGSSRMCRHDDIILTVDQVKLLRSDGVTHVDVGWDIQSDNMADGIQDIIVEVSRLWKRKSLSGGSIRVSSPSSVMLLDDADVDGEAIAAGSPTPFPSSKCIKKKRQVQQKMNTTATGSLIGFGKKS